MKRLFFVLLIFFGCNKNTEESNVNNDVDKINKGNTMSSLKAKMETSKGDLSLALGLGIILISLSILINGSLYMLKKINNQC